MLDFNAMTNVLSLDAIRQGAAWALSQSARRLSVEDHIFLKDTSAKLNAGAPISPSAQDRLIVLVATLLGD